MSVCVCVCARTRVCVCMRTCVLRCALSQCLTPIKKASAIAFPHCRHLSWHLLAWSYPAGAFVGGAGSQSVIRSKYWPVLLCCTQYTQAYVTHAWRCTCRHPMGNEAHPDHDIEYDRCPWPDGGWLFSETKKLVVTIRTKYHGNDNHIYNRKNVPRS